MSVISATSPKGLCYDRHSNLIHDPSPWASERCWRKPHNWAECIHYQLMIIANPHWTLRLGILPQFWVTCVSTLLNVYFYFFSDLQISPITLSIPLPDDIHSYCTLQQESSGASAFNFLPVYLQSHLHPASLMLWFPRHTLPPPS